MRTDYRNRENDIIVKQINEIIKEGLSLVSRFKYPIKPIPAIIFFRPKEKEYRIWFYKCQALISKLEPNFLLEKNIMNIELKNINFLIEKLYAMIFFI